jgi:hypothetical protein
MAKCWLSARRTISEAPVRQEPRCVQHPSCCEVEESGVEINDANLSELTQALDAGVAYRSEELLTLGYSPQAISHFL